MTFQAANVQTASGSNFIPSGSGFIPGVPAIPATYAPAILQSSPAPSLTDRYVHVSTLDVIDIMQNEGFVVESAKVDKVRKSSAEYARHMVVFRNPNIQTPDGSYTPQMLWTNSHNGKSLAKFQLGMYRFICENGLVVGTDLASESVKHVGDLAKQVLDRVRLMSAESSRVFSKIESWSKISMNAQERLRFAEQALELRFGDKKGQYEATKLLKPRRAEDDHGDLWMTFNVIQENSVKGGIVGHNANNRQVSSRSLDAIGQNLTYNQQLWNLAESYAG